MTRYSIKTTSTSNTFNSGNLSAATPKRSVASPWGGLEGATPKRSVASPWGGLVGLGFLLLCLLLASCSDDDGGSRTSDLATIELYVAVPAAPADDLTRIGDPGEDDGEDQSEWNRLTLMFQYFDEKDAPTNQRDLYTITADQFNSLPAWNNDGTIKRVTLPMTKGRVKVYGVTYSSDVTSGIADQIANWEKDNTSVQDLTISNDYAKGDAAERAKFLSVATGFYDYDKDGTPDIFNIEDVITGGLAGTIPVMTLTRLAAKIDIQWDAQEAYGSGYSGIKVTGFTFSGDNENVTGSGSGRLFPSLYTGTEKLSGSKTFINRTPISQRNGRVYHYVYPDGVSTPKVTFNITATENNPDDIKRDYTYTFDAKLQKATWYKIRTYIKGFPEGQETNITITPEGPSEAVTTE